MKCTPGQRDALITILIEGVSEMPGCLSYVVAKDPTDPDSLWITEAWESQDKHKASLSLASVQAAIAKARPILAGFGERFETQPMGGHGLVTTKCAAWSYSTSRLAFKLRTRFCTHFCTRPSTHHRARP